MSPTDNLGGIPADATATSLIPGDPEKLHSLVVLLRAYATSFDQASNLVTTVDEDEWKGTAAIGFRRAAKKLPDTFRKAATQFNAAARALTGYVEVLRDAQNKVKPILEDANEARVAHRTYGLKVEDYNKAVERKDAQLPPRPPDTSPGVTAMNSCVSALETQRKRVVEAGQNAGRALRAAAEAAPDEPGFFSKALGAGRDFLQGAYEGVTELASLAQTVTMPWLDPQKTAMTLAGTIDGLVYGVQHPVEFGKAAINWDMWAENPSRAAGQAVPDLVLGLLTGGSGTAAKAGGGALRRLRPGKKGRDRHDEDPKGTCRTDGGKCKAGEPIDVATGEMILTQRDLLLPGALPLALERTHLSTYTCGGWFGGSWAATLDQHLEIDEQGVVLAGADGILLAYPVPRPGVPVLPAYGPRRPLLWDGTPGGAIRITEPDTGRTLEFAAVPGTVRDPSELPLCAVEDRAGRRTVIVYDEETGAPVELRHHGGCRIAVEVHPHLSRITALRLLDPAGTAEPTLVTAYGYDEAGRLTEVTDHTGVPYRFEYDEDGRITSWTDRTGTSFAYVYDHRGRVLHTVGTDGVLSGRFRYDEANRTTEYTDSLGHTSTYGYDDRYRLTSVTDPLGATTHQVWGDDPAADGPEVITDPEGGTVRRRHDAEGRLVEAVLPDGTRVTTVRNALGQPVEVTGPDGAVWRHTYDAAGNRLSTTDPAGTTRHWAYDAHGHLVRAVDELGHATELLPDAAGLPLARTDALGRTTRVERDALGRPVRVTDPLGRTTLSSWTPDGLLTRRRFPDGQEEHYAYDAGGRLLGRTDALGRATRYTYGTFGLPLTRTAPDGSVTRFTHDTELRLTAVTNPQGLTWGYTWDGGGRLVSETDFDGRTLHYTYDRCDRVASRTNGAGERTTVRRDRAGRVVETRGSDGTVTTREHDAAGRLVRITGPEADVRFERDPLGRVLAESVNGRTTRYTFDALGRRTSRTTPGGHTSTWTYGPDSRAAGLSAATGDRLEFHRDAAGREIERRIGERTSLGLTWTAGGRIAEQTLRHAERGLLHHRSYGYTEDGFLVAEQDPVTGVRRYTLDDNRRVTGAHGDLLDETYAYDSAGNLVSGAAPGEGPGPLPLETQDREYQGTLLRRHGRTVHTQDAQGRTVRSTRRLLNGQQRTWTYEWNTEDRLTAVTTPAGERWRYAYDPMGRRIAKARLAADGTVAERVDFAWDGTRLAEQSTAGGTTVSWDYAPGSHVAVAQTSSGPAGARFHAVLTDHLGTPSELVTPDGAVAWRHRGTVWGLPLPVPAGPDADPGADCPLRFPGQQYDAESGLHYNNQRYYDPATARYLSPDPLGLAPAPHHYAYVANPLDVTDPLGLGPSVPCGEEGKGVSRADARERALREAGVPEGAEPLEERLTPSTNKHGKQNLDENHQPVFFPEEVHLTSDGRLVVYQDHYTGHSFGQGGVGDQAPHVHVRPYEDDRNGVAPGAEPHYYYDPELG